MSQLTSLLQGQDLHPCRHALQLFTDVSNNGWGAYLVMTGLISIGTKTSADCETVFVEINLRDTGVALARICNGPAPVDESRVWDPQSVRLL